MSSNSSKRILITGACILILALVQIAAADQSVGIHIGVEQDMNSGLQVRPGLDFRSLGGRGVIGGEISIDYFPVNSRGYLDSDGSYEESDMIMVSAFGLIQLSMWYGDVAFYAGPGSSYYYMPGVGGYFSLTEDSLIHTKIGVLHTWYPLQVFIESDFDIFFDNFRVDLNHPHVSVGVSLLR